MATTCTRALPGQRATEPLVPEGADDELPELPDGVEIGEADIREALAAWDAAEPDELPHKPPGERR